MGLYIVSGHSHHYYHKNRYYRWHKGAWEKSTHFKGPWKVVSARKLPKSLQKQKHKKYHKERHKKKHKEAKEKKAG